MPTKLDACPLCYSKKITPQYTTKDEEFHITDKEFNLFLCSNCHSYFLNPLPDEDVIKGFYKMDPLTYGAYIPRDPKIKYTGFDHLLQPHHKIYFLNRILQSAFNKDLDNRLLDLNNYAVKSNITFKHVLDVGCGNGSFLRDLSKYFQIPKSCLEGIDIFPDIEKLSITIGITMRNLELQDLPKKPVYDLIILSHVLEHIRDPKKIVQEVEARLVNHGTFLLSVPNSQSLPAHLFGKKWRCHSVPRHLYVFSKDGIVSITQPSFNLEHYSSGDYASNIYRLYFSKGKKILGNYKIGKSIGALLLVANIGDSQCFVLTKKEK